ncbi:uncharacterized protein [Palaemon carinicauda]|uniref:uncharacterized protein n=1 Tax=Palaemon carinicauda TaxID=392227 RepID=UPI0035B5B11A
MASLDIDRFIIETEDRPAIWDVRCNEYSNKIVKAKAWEELCTIFVPGFKEMDSSGKNKATTDIRRKWKSLRDSFRTELALIKKEKSGSGLESGIKEYLYFKQLSFLLQICKTKPHEDERVEDPIVEGNVEKESQPPVPSTHQIKRKKPVLSDEQVLFQALAKKAKAPDDHDKQFLISLVPDFKCIPESAKLDVKLQIMNILERYKQHPTQQYFPSHHNFFPGPCSSMSLASNNFAPNIMHTQSTVTQSQPIPPSTPSPALSMSHAPHNFPPNIMDT